MAGLLTGPKGQIVARPTSTTGADHSGSFSVDQVSLKSWDGKEFIHCPTDSTGPYGGHDMTELPNIPDSVFPDGDYVVSPKIVSQATARKFVGQNGRGYVAIGIVDEAGNPITLTMPLLSQIPLRTLLLARSLSVYLNLIDGSSTDPRGDWSSPPPTRQRELSRTTSASTTTTSAPRSPTNAAPWCQWDYTVGGRRRSPSSTT